MLHELLINLCTNFASIINLFTYSYIHKCIHIEIMYVFLYWKQNKLEPFVVTNQVQHLLLSSIQSQYSQTIVVISTVTTQLSLLGCLPPLLLTAQNGLVFQQAKALIKSIINFVMDSSVYSKGSSVLIIYTI